MNWYTKYIYAQVQGEYWITDTGQAIGADGDINDYNHEGYVIQSILSRYDMDYENNMVDIESPEFLENWVNEEFEDTVEYLVNRNEITPQDGQRLLEEGLNNPDNHEEVVSYLTVSDVMRMKGASENEISAIEGSMDARDFAMQEWGWKRLEGRHIETWTLTPDDLSTISSGLFEAYGEEVSPDEEFTIHIHSKGSQTIMATLAQIDAGRVGESAIPQMHGDAAMRQFNEMDKPSNPYYKDWN